MAAGDFLEVDVICCPRFNRISDDNVFFLYHDLILGFFIDCANNIVSFIETIYKILKNGSFSKQSILLVNQKFKKKIKFSKQVEFGSI
jgi:hypothetical protein